MIVVRPIWLLEILWLWNRFSSTELLMAQQQRAGASPLPSLHFTDLWWAGLQPQQPEASSQRLLSAAPGSAPRSSQVDAGHPPEPISAAGFHPPEAAASAPGARPGPPCPCYCWLTQHRLEFRKKVNKKTTTIIFCISYDAALIWHATNLEDTNYVGCSSLCRQNCTFQPNLPQSHTHQSNPRLTRLEEKMPSADCVNLWPTSPDYHTFETESFQIRLCPPFFPGTQFFI